MQCRKNITVEDKKIMNIANFINIYRNIHTYIILYYIILYYIIFVTRITQDKNHSINTILQHGRVVDNN